VRIAATTIFSILFLSSIGQSLHDVRREFHKAVLNPEDSKAFHRYMKDIEESGSTIQAYAAVSEAMLAQVIWNPFSKLSQVMKYDKQMNRIIEHDPDNIEARFLRLAIEYNLPTFLGMNKHIMDDIEVIKSGIKVSELDVDSYYKRYIFYFLQQTNLCSNEDLAMMEDSFNFKSSD